MALWLRLCTLELWFFPILQHELWVLSPPLFTWSHNFSCQFKAIMSEIFLSSQWWLNGFTLPAHQDTVRCSSQNSYFLIATSHFISIFTKTSRAHTNPLYSLLPILLVFFWLLLLCRNLIKTLSDPPMAKSHADRFFLCLNLSDKKETIPPAPVTVTMCWRQNTHAMAGMWTSNNKFSDCIFPLCILHGFLGLNSPALNGKIFYPQWHLPSCSRLTFGDSVLPLGWCWLPNVQPCLTFF